MDFLIFNPFNPMFFLVLVVAGLLCFLFIRIFRKKSLHERKEAVIILYGIVFVIFMLYKYLLSKDAQYNEILIGIGRDGFNWFGELPLNLCNLNIILTGLGLLLNSRPILGFSFFTGFAGAFAAIIMPPIGFYGYSILLPRMLGYYVTHLAAMLVMPILAGLKLYKPRYSDILPTLGAVFVTTLVITGINLVFIKTGLNVSSNYFYTMNPYGISLLEFLHKLIPIPWVYLLPLIVIVVPYMLLVTFLFNLKLPEKTEKIFDKK